MNVSHTRYNIINHCFRASDKVREHGITWMPKCAPKYFWGATGVLAIGKLCGLSCSWGVVFAPVLVWFAFITIIAYMLAFVGLCLIKTASGAYLLKSEGKYDMKIVSDPEKKTSGVELVVPDPDGEFLKTLRKMADDWKEDEKIAKKMEQEEKEPLL